MMAFSVSFCAELYYTLYCHKRFFSSFCQQLLIWQCIGGVPCWANCISECNCTLH